MRQACISLSLPHTARTMHVLRGEKSGTVVEFSSQAGSAPTDGTTVTLQRGMRKIRTHLLKTLEEQWQDEVIHG